MGPWARSRFEALASGGTSGSNAGAVAAAGWLAERGLAPPLVTRWHAMISLHPHDEIPSPGFDDRIDTRFHVEIFAEEWGFFFCHAGRASWIRVTDIPFVHGRDDHRLLPLTPALADLGQLLRWLERQHAAAFRRDRALVRTNLPGSEPLLRRWIETL